MWLPLILMLTFVPVFAGAGTSGRWILLSIAVPLLILLRDARCAPPWLGILFLLYASISLAWAPDLNEGMQDVWKLWICAGVFVLGATTDLRRVFMGLALGFAVNSTIVVAQCYGWEGILQIAPPAGLFSNKNFGGEAAALVVVGLIGIRLWWLVPLPLITLLLSTSKAGLLAAAIGILFVAPPLIRWAAAALVLIFASVLSESFTGHVGSLMQRVGVWEDLVRNLTWLGHGAGSFYILMPDISVFNRASVRFDFAHNDWLQLVFEYGIGAAPLFAGLILAFVRGTSKVAQAVLLAFIVEGCFGFPLHLPVTAFVAALCAGHLPGHRLPVLAPLFHGKPVLRGSHAHG